MINGNKMFTFKCCPTFYSTVVTIIYVEFLSIYKKYYLQACKAVPARITISGILIILFLMTILFLNGNNIFQIRD